MFAAHSRPRRVALIISATLTLLLVAAWITSAFIQVVYVGSSSLAPEQSFLFVDGTVGVAWGIGGKSEFAPTPKGVMVRRSEGKWANRLGLHSDFFVCIMPFNNLILLPIWLLTVLAAIAFATILRRRRPIPADINRSKALTVALLLPTVSVATLWALSTHLGIEVKSRAFDVSLSDGAITIPSEIDEDEVRPPGMIHFTQANGSMGLKPFELVLSSSSVKIPMWLLLLATAWPAHAAWRRVRPRRPQGRCPCGYDLTLNQSGVCPECGAEVSRPARHATTTNDAEKPQ